MDASKNTIVVGILMPRVRQRITAMLMHHGRVWRSAYWTQAHEQWITGQRFGEPALAGAGALPRRAGHPPRG
jgi:hypothetical protein